MMNEMMRILSRMSAVFTAMNAVVGMVPNGTYVGTEMPVKFLVPNLTDAGVGTNVCLMTVILSQFSDTFSGM